MKILAIFAFFTLSLAVKGWVAMVQPIVLSIGAALVTLNLDLDLFSNIQPFVWKSESEKQVAKKTEQQEVIEEIETLIEENKKLLNDHPNCTKEAREETEQVIQYLEEAKVREASLKDWNNPNKELGLPEVEEKPVVKSAADLAQEQEKSVWPDWWYGEAEYEKFIKQKDSNVEKVSFGNASVNYDYASDYFYEF